MLKIGKHFVDPHKPTLMGILNITPDSFSDGGAFFDLSKAEDHAFKMIEQGVDIIDIGGESSRPGADPITADIEIKRVIPIIEKIRKKSDVPISIDTTKSKVAELAINAGANMINDISAARFDPEILNIARKYKKPICLMHMKGTPKTMQHNPQYTDIIQEIMTFFDKSIKLAKDAGIDDNNIILDPGIGFGKSPEDNILIIKQIDRLKQLNKLVLIGSSRKSFIGKLLNLDLDKRLEPTLATLLVAFQKGANIFRVHDVGASKRFFSMVELLI